MSSGSLDDRLARERNVWLATVRPDGRPHLVPVWYVILEGKWYFCTEPMSVKARNLRRNPRIALALEDGRDPCIIEGEARPVTASAEVVDLFREKYDWDIASETRYTQTFAVVVKKRIG